MPQPEQVMVTVASAFRTVTGWRPARLSRLALVFAMTLLAQGIQPGLGGTPVLRIELLDRAPFYEPAVARARPDATIRWHNPTSTHHTVTHDGCNTGRRCAFDSRPIPPRGSYEIPRLTPGRYPYHCEIHPFMHGVLTVSAPAISPEHT